MNVISQRRIREYLATNAGATTWLEAWWKTANRQQWRSLQEVRLTYPSADQVQGRLIFNAPRGYRLIVGVIWATDDHDGTIFVKHYLSHADYDKDDWKKDCTR